MEELLVSVKNYLDITYEDEETDKKLSGIIARGKAYLNSIAGEEQDYTAESQPRALLLDYCLYARNNVLDQFEKNYGPELVALRIGVQTDDYAKQKGYI
ncbi:MAG: hypothetical protein Q4B70_00985 [Lachnospiraceae bacterium]|nr:hypothetical protein [Lachnospiraceae bacterium]